MTDPTEVNNATSIIVLRALVDANEQRTQDRFEFTGKAVEVALDSNNRRLDGMNEFREALSDQATRMMSRVEALSLVQTSQEKLLAEIKPLRDKIETMGRLNYPAYLGLASLLIALTTGAWVIVGLKIETAIEPVVARVILIEAERGQRNTEVADIQREIRDLSGQFATSAADRRTQFADINGKLIEMRTLSDQRLIIVKAETDEQRGWVRMIYEKVFPEQRFPR